MSYSFHPEAEVEFFAAIDYYEECEPGLGYDFSVETYSAIKRIVDFPEAWSVLDGCRAPLPAESVSVRGAVQY